MANYNHTLDLMACIGAQMVNLKIRPRKEGETDEEYAKVPVLEYACVPTQSNDISVVDDVREEQYRNYSGKHAYLAFSEFDLPNDSKLKQSKRTRLMQSGTAETPYNVPCRELKPKYRKEWQESTRKRYETMIKKQRPELANLEDQGTNLPRNIERNELTRAINAKFPYSLGTGYLRESQQPQQASPYTAYPSNTQYVEPAAQDAFDAVAYADPNSEIPF